jgi:tellurite methyltransferase
MTEADRERWNQRYRDGACDFRPADWLLAHSSMLKPATEGLRALDLACGAGRNSLHLASLGYAVDAWDISDVALGLLGEELERRRAAGHRLDVHPRQIDLDGVVLPPDTYDLVLDVHFLDRSLFKAPRPCTTAPARHAVSSRR